MAANIFASGTADSTVEFDRAVSHLNIFVASGATFSISLDKGEGFMGLSAGFHSFPVGLTFEVRVKSTGAWQLIAVQA